ncbi:hypothetical protein [uncultured Algibacter sp.]|uniref:hypothetical protein n=1 Tax=uncultured Algibacter sp. TaxID=298659 RepID=UPI0026156DD5|nr:hypothetical protein [uncultured Algibacter sp.]
MKKLTIIYALLIGIGISSCSSDNNNCLKSKTIDVGVIEELKIVSHKEIYADSNYEIWISTFSSPNGDGIRDTFTIIIIDINNGGEFDSSTSTNAVEFLKSAELKISNECEEIFSTNNINNLTWYPGYQPPQPEGIYNVNLKLTLANDTNIDITDSFEVILTSDLP